ncbi:hypothetical protein CY34DRAFT_804423 [Suillus luteus UH-Slu-Lm8-n1]|uniref:Uncharacterized protein n=1 Tax=Suillus luteus UH-Slu-Lm8-n1 TaxID=930992 RepID=A0A0D0B935_9AGAM|nr:hypothetical protein CY34DRAFT_804423 [Suillus luteus UH-Slu-Lm8-n1]
MMSSDKSSVLRLTLDGQVITIPKQTGCVYRISVRLAHIDTAIQPFVLGHLLKDRSWNHLQYLPYEACSLSSEHHS